MQRHHERHRLRMDLAREANPKDDRVQIVISGKFPPYKTY